MRRSLLLLIALLTCIASTVAAAAPQPDQTIVIKGRREASEASWANKHIRYIPFEVPAGTTKITVKLAFDWGPNKDEKRTVDTGLFDSRGHSFGGPGFRGWQGGNASDIVVSGDRATTCRYYLAGPIYPGTWNIAQRFVRSTTAGLNYTYTITFAFDGPTPPAAFPVPTCTQDVIDPAAGWYPGDLHLHTIHSDGNKTLVQSIEQHESQGYRFMVSTDHNTSATHYDFADAAGQHPKTLLVYGEEWTTGSGHANVVGMHAGSWIDFRVDAADGKLPAVIEEVHKMGAMFVLNHPCSIKWKYPDAEWSKADAVEVWNGGFGADDAEAIVLWDSQIKTGRRITAIGGTDTHGGNARTPATFVYARNLSELAIMEGLRKGTAFVSESPAGPRIFIMEKSGKAWPGDTIKTGHQATFPLEAHIIGGKGMTLRLVWSASEEKIAIDSDDTRINRDLMMDPTKKHGYVRAELLKPNGNMAALTNAIYMERE